MTAQEAINYIENQTWSGTRLGLERTRELMARLGNVQEKLRFIHVAGSNGKGSTCSMLSSVLRAAKIRTGLYISPHLVRFQERMSVDGAEISDAELAHFTERVKEAAEAMEDHPSQFELSTAIALLYFYEKHCDLVILEVGLGGESDSTNVIPAPEVAVIANLGLEHTEYLGNTIEEVAAAKAGIIKTGCRCVCYNSTPAAVAVVEKVCRQKNVPFLLSDNSGVQSISQSLSGQVFCYRGNTYRLGLLGRHQLRNAATVIDTVRTLNEAGWQITEENLAEGLAKAVWPARMEILGRDPLFLLDGGHNPQCAEALAENWPDLFGTEKAVFLLGVLADKDYRAMIGTLLPCAESFVCVTPDSPRALPARELAEVLTAFGAKAVACETAAAGVREALGQAKADGTATVGFGSLYLAGAVREAFLNGQKEGFPAITE